MLGVTVHWEVAAPRADHARCAAQVAEVRAYHLSKGYSDIAYNWLACTHGGIFQGRGWGRISGANGTTYSNLNYWAVCAMTGPGQPHTPELRAALGALVAEGLRRSSRPEVWPHSHWFNTACCGDIIRAWIAAGLGSFTFPVFAKSGGTDAMIHAVPNSPVAGQWDARLFQGNLMVRKFPPTPQDSNGLPKAATDYVNADPNARVPIRAVTQAEMDALMAGDAFVRSAGTGDVTVTVDEDAIATKVADKIAARLAS